MDLADRLSVGVIGFIRIAVVYNPHGSTTSSFRLWILAKMQIVSFPTIAYWVSIQLSFAVICSCLPTYRPFLSHLSFPSTAIKQWYSSIRSRLRKSTILSGSQSKPSDFNTGEASKFNHVQSVRYDHYLNVDYPNDTMMLKTAVEGRSNDHHGNTAWWIPTFRPMSSGSQRV